MSIVEGILESEPVPGVTEVILDDFKAKHCSDAFFCRHRKCPRAVQGFNTPELRQMHEESHVPKFQCTEVACGFFGWPFNTQAAFKKHTIQYHDEEKIASMPDSLANVQCRSLEDRSLFTLTKSNEKRKVEGVYSPWGRSGGTFVDNDDDEFSRANANAMLEQELTENVTAWPPWTGASGDKAPSSPHVGELQTQTAPTLLSLSQKPIAVPEDRHNYMLDSLFPISHQKVVDKGHEEFGKTAGNRRGDFEHGVIEDDGTIGLPIEDEMPPPQNSQQRSMRHDTPLKPRLMDLLRMANDGHSNAKAASPVEDAPSPFPARSLYAR